MGGTTPWFTGTNLKEAPTPCIYQHRLEGGFNPFPCLVLSPCKWYNESMLSPIMLYHNTLCMIWIIPCLLCIFIVTRPGGIWPITSLKVRRSEVQMLKSEVQMPKFEVLGRSPVLTSITFHHQIQSQSSDLGHRYNQWIALGKPHTNYFDAWGSRVFWGSGLGVVYWGSINKPMTCSSRSKS